jgi:hypothetical protein
MTANCNWRKLEAVLTEAFADRPDIEEAAARAVAFLRERMNWRRCAAALVERSLPGGDAPSAGGRLE